MGDRRLGFVFFWLLLSLEWEDVNSLRHVTPQVPHRGNMTVLDSFVKFRNDWLWQLQVQLIISMNALDWRLLGREYLFTQDRLI